MSAHNHVLYYEFDGLTLGHGLDDVGLQRHQLEMPLISNKFVFGLNLAN